MTVEDVQAAEIRAIRALRMVAITLSDSAGDICRITVQGNDEAPADVRVTQRLAWSRVSRLLRLTVGTINNVIDNNGPAFEGHPDLVDHCETAIKELEDQARLTSSLRFTKRIEKENLRFRDQA